MALRKQKPCVIHVATCICVPKLVNSDRSMQFCILCGRQQMKTPTGTHLRRQTVPASCKPTSGDAAIVLCPARPSLPLLARDKPSGNEVMEKLCHNYVTLVCVHCFSTTESSSSNDSRSQPREQQHICAVLVCLHRALSLAVRAA